MPRLRTRRAAAKKGVIKRKQLTEREARKFRPVATEYERDDFVTSDAASVSSASLSSESEEEEKPHDLTNFLFETSEKLLACKDEIITLQKQYINALLGVIAAKHQPKTPRGPESISRAPQ
jgi:hypothetical protein